jgi:hypothetical protein
MRCPQALDTPPLLINQDWREPSDTGPEIFTQPFDFVWRFDIARKENKTPGIRILKKRGFGPRQRGPLTSKDISALAHGSAHDNRNAGRIFCDKGGTEPTRIGQISKTHSPQSIECAPAALGLLNNPRFALKVDRKPTG